MHETSNKNGKAIMVRCDTCGNRLYSTAMLQCDFYGQWDDLKILWRQYGWRLDRCGQEAICPVCLERNRKAKP